MNISYPNTTTPADIFAPSARERLATANFLASPVMRMGIALQSTQGHIFAGVDLHLAPEHREQRRQARRAAGKRQRQARKAARA